MRCSRCGKINNEGANFCKYCGWSLSLPEDDRPGKDRPHLKLLYVMIGVISVLIIALSSLFVWKQLGPSGSESGDNKGEENGSSIKDEETKEHLYSIVGQKFYSDIPADDPVADYITDEEYRFSAHTDKDAFEPLGFDNNRYSFACPRYLFNKSIISSDSESESYYYYYDAGDGGKEVPSLYVTAYDDPGDIMERTENLRNKYVTWCKEYVGKDSLYISKKPFKNDDGIMIADTRLNGPSTDDYKTGIYIIASNDGKRSHVLIFEYPVKREEGEGPYKDYVIECVYRYCSFGGTSKKPRSFQEFQEENNTGD